MTCWVVAKVILFLLLFTTTKFVTGVLRLEHNIRYILFVAICFDEFITYEKHIVGSWLIHTDSAIRRLRGCWVLTVDVPQLPTVCGDEFR